MSYTGVSLGLPFSAAESVANACSGDGKIIVGYIVESDFVNDNPVYWDENLTAFRLPVLGPGGKDWATGISEDGTIIIGFSRNSSGFRHAVYWSNGPSWVVNDLGVLAGPSDNESFTLGCNSDCTLIVGVGETAGSSISSLPCIWVNFGTIQELTGAPSGSGALAASANGVFIAGGASNFSGLIHPGSSWTNSPTWDHTTLTDSVGAIGPSGGASVSNAGTVYGYTSDASGITYAASWDTSGNLTVFGDAGSSVVGCDPTGVYLIGSDSSATLWISGVPQTLTFDNGGESLNGISSDTTIIVGTGTDDDFNLVGVKWTFDSPPPPLSNSQFELSKLNVIQYITPNTNNEMTMKYSDNAGAKWSASETMSTGETGEYMRQVHFHQLGIARNKVFGLFGGGGSIPTPITGVSVNAKESRN